MILKLNLLVNTLSKKLTLILVLSYAFPFFDWNITELEIIDSKTRKVLLQYHAIHSQSDVTRLYLPRKNGGRGLTNITNHYKNTIINISSYLLNSEE